MPGKPHLCWDACAYISLLTGERRTTEEMRNLRAIEQMVSAGNAIVFSSTIAMVEVLACHLTAEQATKFKGLLGNPDTPFQPVDSRIAELAHEIRSFYVGKVSVPDAIYLATAIHYEATAFHTFDGCSHRKRPGDLLRLQQPIAGKYNLRITPPEVPSEPAPEPLSGSFVNEFLPFAEAEQELESLVADKENAAVTVMTAESDPPKAEENERKEKS